jgi:hypothetical protein
MLNTCTADINSSVSRISFGVLHMDRVIAEAGSFGFLSEVRVQSHVIYVGSVVKKLALGQDFPLVLRFPTANCYPTNVLCTSINRGWYNGPF